MTQLSHLEISAGNQPNSIEIHQTLAEAYASAGRWEEAARAYRLLVTLYPDTGALFINRLRLGASALVLSSLLMLLGAVIHPALSIQAMSSPGELGAFAAAMQSPAYLGAQLLFIVALALYSCSAISIYKLLSYTRDHRPAFWAMVLSVIGVGLSMPVLGIRSFVFPLVAGMALQGRTEVIEIYFSLNEPPVSLILGLGGYLLAAGIALFGWVSLRNSRLSLPSILVFLAGWAGIAAAGNPVSHLGWITLGILIALGGTGLGRSLWIEASTQFDPAMDRSTKS